MRSVGRSFARVAVALALIGMAAPLAWGDDVRPVQLQIREQEPGTFVVQWQVPQVIPAQAMPVPRLPGSCTPRGERTLVEQPGAWLNSQVFRCSSEIAGEMIGIEFPFGNPSLSTVLRIEFLNGERHATLLAPTETSWRIPETASVDAPLRRARDAVLDGVRHVFSGGLHIGFLAAIVALGSPGLIARFGMGHLGAVLLSSLGVGIAFPLGELSLGLASLLLAREALREPAARGRLDPLVVAAGVAHGAGWGTALGGAMPLLFGVLGMDAVLFALGALSLRVVQSRFRVQRAVAYGAGVMTVAFGLGVWSSGSYSDTGATRTVGPPLPALAGGRAAGGPGSRRVAPQSPDAAIQSFLAIEGLEVRHEVLVRLRDVTLVLNLGDADLVPVDEQSDIKRRVADLVASGHVLEIDGSATEPSIEIVDFMTVDAQGVLPRPTPVPETLNDAFVGVTVVHLTPSTAQRVALTWGLFDLASEIPTTVTDPEVSRVSTLTSDEPGIRWDNVLARNPVPTVEATLIEPRRFPVPLLSLPFLLVALLMVSNGMRGKGPARSFAYSRVALAIGLLVGPWGAVSMVVPFSSAPTEVQAQRILAGILPNVYRAFEYRDEATAYDRLAVSITGETLTDIYLEHRRALELEERGGARARPEAVEVIGVTSVRAGATGGFATEASWSVSGTVTHYGHRHFRQNRYRALVTVVAADGAWKIRSVDIIDEVRVQ